VAQVALPMLVMFAIMFPMMMRQASKTADFRHATLWQGDVWYVENVLLVSWRVPWSGTCSRSTTAPARGGEPRARRTEAS
jgi:hypothetical protein